MQRTANHLVPDTPTPFVSQDSSSGSQAFLPTSIRPLRSRDALSNMRAPSSSLPASPGLQGINMDVSMESDRRAIDRDQRRAGQAFDENSPRYGSAPARTAYVRKPSNLRAHISSDSSESSEDDSGSLRIRMSHQHPARNNSPKPAQPPRSPSLSAMSSPQRPAYRSMTHDSPVSGFDGMARELRREFERITNAQHQQSTAASITSSPGAAGKKNTFDRSSQLGRRVFADVSNHPASPSKMPSPKGQYFDAEPQKQQRSMQPSPQIGPTRPGAEHIFGSPEAPTRRASTFAMPDVTGITEGLASPEKAMGYRKLASPDRRSNDSSNSVKAALGELEGKLSALEMENSRSTHRIKQLEAELHHQRDFPEAFHRRNQHDSALGTASSERASRTHMDMSNFPTLPAEQANGDGALESLVERLHAHVARLTKSLNTHSHALEDLKEGAAPQSDVHTLRRQMTACDEQVSVLRSSIETLSLEVSEVRQLVEGLMSQRPGPNTVPRPHSAASAPAATTARSHFSEPAQSWQRSLANSYSAPRPTSAPPPQRQVQHSEPTRKSRPTDPELERAEAILRSMPPAMPPQPVDASCSMCQHEPRHRHQTGDRAYTAPQTRFRHSHAGPPAHEEDEGFAEYGADDSGVLPPQTLLSRALRELESDFESHKAIYIELSEAYKKIDPASNASKRRTLASHLKESVDSLETKADEIKRLYDLLHYEQSPPARPASRGY